MRLELAGHITVDPKPKTIPFDDVGSHDFDTEHWMDLGYTDFDVICIGGGGGRGGGIDTGNTGTLWRTYGGEGGGGGYHRVQGKLAGLPSPCPVVVGAAGVIGHEDVSNPLSTTDGTNGSYSSFNGTFCCASGGMGGKKAQAATLAAIATTNPQADGGRGGKGNSLAVGGGDGLGGVCGDPDTDDSTDGEDGPITDDIGHGGGGGAGGVSKYGTPGVLYLAATAGGRGSYNPVDTLVAGDPEDPDYGGANVEDSKPGRGGGAKATPLNGLPYNYGRAGEPGAVFIYLTAK
jgi:hypothetical protein